MNNEIIIIKCTRTVFWYARIADVNKTNLTLRSRSLSIAYCVIISVIDKSSKVILSHTMRCLIIKECYLVSPGLCYCEFVTRHPSSDRQGLGATEGGPYRAFYRLVGELAAVVVAASVVMALASVAAACAVALVSATNMCSGNGQCYQQNTPEWSGLMQKKSGGEGNYSRLGLFFL